MKTIIKTTLATLALVVGASASQAEAVWHFPYKDAPYATQSAPVQQAAPVRVVRHGKHVHVMTAGKNANHPLNRLGALRSDPMGLGRCVTERRQTAR